MPCGPGGQRRHSPAGRIGQGREGQQGQEAQNQRVASRRSANTKAPSGELNDHKITALEFTNPPSDTNNRNGNSSGNNS